MDSARRHHFHRLVYFRRPKDTVNLPALLQFLQGTLTVAKHVRILDLRGFKGSRLFQHRWCRISSRTFKDLLEALPNVDQVEMNEATFLEVSTPSRLHVGSGKRLKSLRFYDVKVQGPDYCSTLLRILQPISSVQILQVLDIPCVHTLPPGHTIQEQCGTLDLPTHLEIETLVWENDSELMPFFLEIIRRNSPRRFRHLHYWYRSRTDDINPTYAVQEFLNDIGDELESLSLKVTGTPRMSFYFGFASFLFSFFLFFFFCVYQRPT